MGIVDVKNVPNSLWDQLIALNDLVQSVKDTKNLNDIVSNIRAERDANKKQADDLQTLKAQDDITTQNLRAATDANNKSIADLNAARNEANDSRASADAQITKAGTAQKLLAQAQADFDMKTTQANADLAKREKAVSDRETSVTQRENDVESMKDDYQSKLDNLKKLTE